jgi:hypothetical protein
VRALAHPSEGRTYDATPPRSCLHTATGRCTDVAIVGRTGIEARLAGQVTTSVRITQHPETAINMSNDELQNDLNLLHLFLLIFGGLLAGTGILNLYYAFGWTGGDLNSSVELVGFSGLDNIGLLPGGELYIGLVVAGALCMIGANATAWRKTDGY